MNSKILTFLAHCHGYHMIANAEYYHLLGCDFMYFGTNSLMIEKNLLPTSSGWFGITYCLHL
jgi:hypothetical protein